MKLFLLETLLYIWEWNTASPKLHSIEKHDISNGFHAKEQKKIIFKRCIRFAFLYGTNCIEVIFEMCPVGSEKERAKLMVIWIGETGDMEERSLTG